ncbi:MAG: hypothetical protein A2W93_01220 [Bacteroidetes bacterium GWF2_43_63]|nr:MAG: hypothetical protein A2W94_10850 [Bacteroidetes bacterium GWE2_42_42]OFY55699.1 MAG: hypothetical protein A2W93_01220 [Bacteroidetes bacterium GWF2_43_63]HBG69494.1 hypothetical protein [Bacteroidales bacterium]HCB61339.1 hypothetical protein [Bacteroidales bacterium]HCY24214.1 hypothetical protein [Bacteroidales bacterium]
MKKIFIIILLVLTADGFAQTVYSSNNSCGIVRYFSMTNVAEAVWNQPNDSTGELHFYDQKSQVSCLVSVGINPLAEPVYIGSSDLFSEVKIDLKSQSALRLTIKEKQNSEPFFLTLPATPTSIAVPVDYKCFSAVRHIAFETEEGRDSVSMTIEHMYPVPAANTPKADSLWFIKAICSMYEGLPVDAVYPDDMIKNFDISYIQDYTSMYESGEAEIDEFISNWEIYDEVSVLFQKNGLLGFVSAGYEYTGGAHGLYGSVNYTYDSQSGKLLTLEDIFVINYESILETAINDQLRSDLNLAPDALLSDEGFFVEVVTATQNFILSETSITFHYNVYEIAPYAAGSIDITIPYSDLKSIIPAGGVIERMME